MQDDGSQRIILVQKENERNWMDCNVAVLIWDMIGYEKYYQYGLEHNGSQHDNTIWNMIDINESDWDGKELNVLQR